MSGRRCEFVLGKADVSVSLECKVAISSHYAFVAAHAAPMGFIQAIGHSDIMLVNDVSDYAPEFEEKYPGCRLVTLRTNPGNKFHNDDPNFYFNALKNMGYLPQHSQLVQYHHREIAVKKLTGHTIKLLKRRMGSSVKFLLADDLGIMSPIAQLYK